MGCIICNEKENLELVSILEKEEKMCRECVLLRELILPKIQNRDRLFQITALITAKEVMINFHRANIETNSYVKIYKNEENVM